MSKKSAPDYLKDLAKRLMNVPAMYGTDGADIDRLGDIAREIGGHHLPSDGDRRLLERCQHEIKNLMTKLAAKEDAGWEGEQRRSLLLSDLNKALS